MRTRTLVALAVAALVAIFSLISSRDFVMETQQQMQQNRQQNTQQQNRGQSTAQQVRQPQPQRALRRCHELGSSLYVPHDRFTEPCILSIGTHIEFSGMPLEKYEVQALKRGRWVTVERHGATTYCGIGAAQISWRALGASGFQLTVDGTSTGNRPGCVHDALTN